MHQMVSRTSGTGWWITPNGNPEACGGEEKTNRHILPDNSNVGMIVHKGCIRKSIASGRPCVGRFPSLIKMRMYSFVQPGRTCTIILPNTGLLRLDHLKRT
jgi:hypothetical protein